MGLGGKQPRIGGKAPRFPTKQPRRAQITDTDSEEEAAAPGEAVAAEVEDILESEDDAKAADGDDDEDYEDDGDEEEEVDRWGFLKATNYSKAPSYFTPKKIQELLALLPSAEAEAVDLLTGLKRDERMGQLIDKYTEAFEFQALKAQMEQEEKSESLARRDTQKPRSQKAKDTKKGALKELMESKRALERGATPTKGKRGRANALDGDAEEEDEDMDVGSDGGAGDDDDEDYEEGRSRRLTRRSRRAASPATMDHEAEEIMAGLDSDDDDDDDDDMDRDEDADRFDFDADDGGEDMLEPEEATLEDLNRARLPRALLAKYVHEPFFEQMVKGAFVRVPIGKVGGRNTYRVAFVEGVGEYKRMYAMVEDASGRKVYTRKILLMRSPGGASGATRDLDMSRVSNHRITPQEYEDFKKVLRDKNAARVGPNQCRRIAERITNLPKNYKYRAEDVMRITEARGVEMGGATNLRRLDAVERDLQSAKIRRDEAVALLGQAQAAFDAAEEQELGAGPAERDNLEQARAAVATTDKDMTERLSRREKLVQQTAAKRAQASRLDNGMYRINRRNEAKNLNTIFASGDRKRRGIDAGRQVDAAEGADLDFGFAAPAGSVQASPAKRRKEKPTFDPFKRRLTRPTILWATRKEEGPGAAGAGVAEEAAVEEPKSRGPEERKAEPILPVEERKPREDLEALMCRAMTPEDLHRYPEVDPNDADATLHAAATAFGLPWPLPLTDPAQVAEERAAGKSPLVQPNFFLVQELAAAERYLVARRRVYRAIKMHMNFSRWGPVLKLARAHPKYLDLVLARRMAFLEKSGAIEHISGYRDLAGRGADLDIEALKRMSVSFEEEDRKLDESQRKKDSDRRGGAHPFMIYSLAEYHARREEQFTDQ